MAIRLRFRNAPAGAKIMTILVIMIPIISLCVMIYFILKQFGVISKDECKKHSECNSGMYCTFNTTFKHKICENCCGGLNKQNCGACHNDPHRIGDSSLCPDFTCDTSQ